MKTKYIIMIVVAAVVAVVIASLLIALNIRGAGYGGDIGVIEINEVILSSKTHVRDLKNFLENPGIMAILVRVDSPGGGVAASQEIYEQLRRASAKKKVVVSMGAVAASGGYYISLPADVIVANPGTITGSIGVIMEFPVLSELLKKIGISFEVVKSRPFKDIGSPYRKMSDDERKILGDLIFDVYDQFVGATAAHRHLDRDSVLKLADGRIFTGRQAKACGLVDTLGTFEDAVDIAGDLVGIEKPYLVYPPRRMSFWQILTEPMEELLRPKLQYLWR